MADCCHSNTHPNERHTMHTDCTICGNVSNTGKICTDCENAKGNWEDPRKNEYGQPKNGYTIWAHPVTVIRHNCDSFTAWYPEQWETPTQYTGPHAYDNMLSDLYDNGHLEAFYNIRAQDTPCPDTDKHQCGLYN